MLSNSRLSRRNFTKLLTISAIDAHSAFSASRRHSCTSIQSIARTCASAALLLRSTYSKNGETLFQVSPKASSVSVLLISIIEQLCWKDVSMLYPFIQSISGSRLVSQSSWIKPTRTTSHALHSQHSSTTRKPPPSTAVSSPNSPTDVLLQPSLPQCLPGSSTRPKKPNYATYSTLSAPSRTKKLASGTCTEWCKYHSSQQYTSRSWIRLILVARRYCAGRSCKCFTTTRKPTSEDEWIKIWSTLSGVGSCLSA